VGGERDAELVRLRRELDRLRAENARLARLLDLRGQDTTPAAEQLAMPIAPELVTMGSSLTDKLTAYGNRFRARTDAYALYWEHPRKGIRGWMPAVAGGWHKGMDRSRARYRPLTSEVLEQHLSGDVFIGLYPLFPDNSCRFLVADFDGQAAMLDALAYAKAARETGVPAAVELSKSGRGAHVWVFFAGAVAAVTARAVGTVLLHEAMLLRGAMDLRSYDRLFPSQDVLPDGGLGNLIAAPLQGSRRTQGLTVFLDLATLEPHPDQWEFLSTLDRLSPGDAAGIARRARRTVVGSEITQLSRSAATKVQPRLRGYDVTLDDRLMLPRALRHAVGAIVERAGSQLVISDCRNPGTEIDVTFGGTLDDRQSSAVSAALAHDDGVLVAPAGSGKTVMACAVIAERGISTLILLDRLVLAEQWRDRIVEFLAIRPGQLGGGRSRLTGRVDIAMLPTLAPA
jgi:hypothetical protein